MAVLHNDHVGIVRREERRVYKASLYIRPYPRVYTTSS